MGVRDIEAIRQRRTSAQRFRDLATYSGRIIGYTAHLPETEFQRDSETVAAIERCLSIVGDLVDTLDDTERRLCPTASLAPFAGLGDYLIHGNRSVDLHKLRQIACRDVPLLRTAVERTLREHFPGVPRS